MHVRVVLPVFEVRQVTANNAVDLARWLAMEAERLGAPPHDVPTVSWAYDVGKPPSLIAYDPNYMASVPITPGRWIGWGYPRQNEIHVDPAGKRPVEGLKLCILDAQQIDGERFDYGIEEVRLG